MKTVKQISRTVVTMTVGALAVTAFLVALPLSWGNEHHGHSSSAKKEGTQKYLFGNHKCPATGETVVPEGYVEYRNEEKRIYGRIYICCKGCSKKTKNRAAELYGKFYRTDPKTGKERGPIDLKNPTCPMSGEAVTKKDWIEYNGMIVHFCCADCVDEFLKDPDSKLAKLVKDADDYKYERPAGSGSSR